MSIRSFLQASSFRQFVDIHRLSPRGGRLIMLVVAALFSVLLLLIFRSGFDVLEERLGALGWTLFADVTLEERVPIVAIDERSLSEVGSWPWTRLQVASLVSAIDSAGAQLQLHDIVYPEAKAGDAELLSALQASNGALLAQVPDIQLGQTAQAGLMTHPLSGISCNAGSGLQFPSTSSYLSAPASFSAIPKGHIASVISADGAVRKTPAIVCVDNQAYPALALAALLQANKNATWEASITPGSNVLDPAYILRFNAYPGLDIPLDSEGNLRISFASSPAAFIAISAADVISGAADMSMLDGQWVLVGVTAFGTGDIVPTPYSGATPGVELHARLLASVLDFDIPYTPKSALLIQIFLSLIFAAMLYLIASKTERLTAYGLSVAVFALPLAALLLHIQLLQTSNLWLGWVAPALYSALASGLLLLLEHSRVRAERSRVFGNLSSYLPNDIAREIAYSVPNSSINAKRCDVTLLSADLRNFSAFGEARAPEESAAVLHFFFTRATEIIEQHGGRVHEFKGDSLLAVWDGHHQSAATAALKAGIAMQSDLSDSLLTNFAPNGLEPLALGVGIEQGPALIGSIGPAHRRSHTLLGDTVAITLRIQEMTADLAQPILIGECAARQLGDQALESQGSYLLAGLKTPHVLFAPLLSTLPGLNTSSGILSADTASHQAPDLKLVKGGHR
jgi:class 3 adenylate cyclase/CHASE2 domain-containing sensor protein